MSRPSLHACAPVLAVLLSVFSAAVFAATPPVLFKISAGVPTILAQGAQKSWPIKVSESNAFDAIFKGGMWLPNPAGGQIYAKYQRHILHANGTWTWDGTVETVHGEQPVVLTFGKDGVFGLISQSSGYPLRIVSDVHGSHLVVTSAAAMARSAEALRLRSTPDYLIPPKVNPRTGGLTSNVPSVGADAAMPAAAASGPVTIDVMVVYTQGFVAERGSQSLALTRIQNLVDFTNQAYVASGVNQQIRLVYTAQVNYPDNTSNQSALDDITGINENGSTVAIPASLQNVAVWRTQYGADLVALFRGYDNATQGNCGVGWLIGGNQAPIVPSQSNVYGYSVVSDGSSGGFYCLDSTFAHELGHNMGSAHDRANAGGTPGAYSYSYGYVGNGTNGFSTIMAYGSSTDTPLSVFSNPNISTCQNTPCGVADNASDSADNAHSLNNTAPLIAQFEPTMVGSPPPQISDYVRNDVNGDGYSDLLWMNTGASSFGYWLMNGATSVGSWAISVASGYRVVATGDFNKDGETDLVWQGKAGDLYLWTHNGSTYASQPLGNAPSGASVVGAGDIDGDGDSDLLFLNAQTGAFTYWLMNGSFVVGQTTQNVAPGYTINAIGDFNGDGRVDLAWTSAKRDLYIWIAAGNGFNAYYMGVYPAGWTLIGAGDVNGDGMSDLLWRNQGAGLFGYWIMNGASQVSGQAIPAAGNYNVAAVGDFNGDGKVDVMWTSSARDLYLWTSKGASFASQYVGIYPAGWAVVPSQLMAAGKP